MTPLVNVFGVISPGDARHTVIVERAVSIKESYSQETAAVSDALVRLSDGETTVTLEAAWTGSEDDSVRPGTYVIDADKLPVEYGKSYGMTVETPSGEVIEGETLVPSPFDIDAPGDTIRISPTMRYDVNWTESPGAHRYLLYAYEYIPGVDIDFENTMYIEDGTADTTGIVYYIFNQPGMYIIEVWAVDLNMHDYYLSRADQPELELINHLSGGIGLFGSRVVRRRIVIVSE
jgi:hypothetical protein